MTEQQRELLIKLLKTYGASSTERLIGYLTSMNGMLDACRALLDDLGNRDVETISWLQEQCERYGHSHQQFQTQIRNITGMFSAHEGNEDLHDVLGVSFNATQEEIKRAYRKLSLKYHPDTATDRDRATDQFIRITRAYHALIEGRPEPTSTATANATSRHRQQVQWRRTSKRRASSVQRRTLFAWTAGLLVLIIFVSLLAANVYRKKTMLAGLQHSQGAFIPPARVSVAATVSPQWAEVEEISHPRETRALPVAAERSEKQASRKKAEETVAVDSPEVTSTRGAHLAKEPRAAPEAAAGQPDDNRLPQRIQNEPAIIGTNASSGKRKIEMPILPESEKRPSPEKIVVTAPGPQESDVSEVRRPVTKNGQKNSRATEIVDIKRNESQLPEAQDLPPASKDTPKHHEKSDEPEESHVASATIIPQVIQPSTENVATEAKNSASGPTTQQPPLESRLHSFFEVYLRAYNDRNILQFSGFFAPEAVENDKPFATRVQTYLELFENTDRAELQLLDLDWKESPKNVQVDGRFTVDLHYRDGNHLVGTGPITFLLKTSDSSFLIETLYYHFER